MLISTTNGNQYRYVYNPTGVVTTNSIKDPCTYLLGERNPTLGLTEKSFSILDVLGKWHILSRFNGSQLVKMKKYIPHMSLP